MTHGLLAQQADEGFNILQSLQTAFTTFLNYLPQLIGALLVAESLGQHLDKGYIYFAMAFAVGVELVNARLR